MTWTEGPVEFAGVVSQVVDHDDGALAQLHQFLGYAENRLWERHDNHRAETFAAARKRLEEIGDELARTAAEMLSPPARPRRAALTRSSQLPAPLDAGARADWSRAGFSQAEAQPPRPGR